MKTRTVLYLNHAAYIGGAEIALLDLMTHMDRNKYSPVVLVPNGTLADALRRLHVRCVPIPVLPGLNRYTLPEFLGKLPQLISLIRREQPALIHANTNFASLYSGAISKIIKIPSIGLIQDIEPLGRMGRLLVRQNTKTIAISEAVRKYLIEEHVPEENITRIHHGVDLKKYQPRTGNDAQDSSSISDVIIGIVGQMGERKGHLYLLEAMKSLIGVYPHIKLWIVGKEPSQSAEHYTESLHDYVRTHQLEPYVKFFGFRSDIPDILKKLDILILSSLQEPFGKIVIEAMATGKPVIASKVGGVPEIVMEGKTGFLVPPGDSDSLYHALKQLVSEPKTRQQMGIEGRDRVERLFSIEKTVRSTERLYEQVFDELSL